MDLKKENLIFNSDSYWICCMYGFSGLSSILGNISLVLGNNSLAAVWMYLTKDSYHSFLPCVPVSVAK